VKTGQDNFIGSAQRNIFYQWWEPDEGARAVLFLVHGAGEHSGRYKEFAQYFVDRGYAVAALDHNGHGRSDGLPGYVESFEDYVGDVGLFWQECLKRFPDKPFVLVGHSLGGLISAHFLRKKQDAFVGAVLSGALAKVEPTPPWIQDKAVRLLALLAPRLGVIKLDPSEVSRDPQVVEKYANDELVFHGKMSARQLREMFDAMASIRETAGEIQLPLLLLHGGQDSMASPEGSRILAEVVGSRDKTLKIYPELYHEIFNEPERLEVWEDVARWCESRLKLG
jgi:alpha-beta hydrolase superfamily lysophospholipase